MFASATGFPIVTQHAPNLRFFHAGTLATRRCALRFALPFALLRLASGAVHAQVINSGDPLSVFAVAVPLTSAPIGEFSPTGVLSHFDAVGGIQTDVLFGRNAEGPYTLSWKKARANSETVDRDGRALLRDIDYVVDSAAGTIRFATSLPAGNTVRITYLVNTLEAARNVPEAHLLHIDLLSKGKNRLRLRTQLREDTVEGATSPSASTANSQFGINALQWTGSTPLLRSSLLTSQLDSRVFMDLQGGDWRERADFRLCSRQRWVKPMSASPIRGRALSLRKPRKAVSRQDKNY